MEDTVIVADAGNSYLKIGVFENSILVKVYRILNLDVEDWIKKTAYDKKIPITIASVAPQNVLDNLKQYFTNCIIIDNKSKLPYSSKYNTPETLGVDRICNVAALKVINPNKNSVSIDIGTCIKFDLLTDLNNYEGGSISPGLLLRYKSLHDYTAKLPLIIDNTKADIVGKSTYESIHSGVVNGIHSEILGMMAVYEQVYDDLTFFMTGGDSQYFDFHGKNNIFVDENLTLKGLYHLYQLNAH